MPELTIISPHLMSTPDSTPTHLPWATQCQSRLYGFGLWYSGSWYWYATYRVHVLINSSGLLWQAVQGGLLVFDGFVSGINISVHSTNVESLICKQLCIHYKICLGCLILDETARPSFMGLKTAYTICLCNMKIWQILMYNQVLLWLLTLHVYSTCLHIQYS
jgi:hypothetical protein